MPIIFFAFDFIFPYFRCKSGMRRVCKGTGGTGRGRGDTGDYPGCDGRHHPAAAGSFPHPRPVPAAPRPAPYRGVLPESSAAADRGEDPAAGDDAALGRTGYKINSSTFFFFDSLPTPYVFNTATV